MPQHSANEQYLLELINAERAKAGVQPLVFDNDLSEAAEGHSRWMIATDVFSHTGAGGTSSTQRMKAAGYVLQGSWATGENIAWATTRSPAGYQDEVKLLHTNLMNSSGHRANLLNGNFREVGLGFEVGDYRGRSTAFITEDFGKTGTTLFLTGVAFDDRDGDRFYDPGEGLSGITVTARNSSGATYKTTTMDAGGYDLVLKPGSYTVTFSGPGMAASTQSVTIGTKNVKKDLVDPVITSGTLSADASVDELGSAPAPVPNTATDGDGRNATGNAWLADFLKRSSDWDAARGDSRGDRSQTLADNASASDVSGHNNHSRALDGEHLHFQRSVQAAGNVQEITDLFDGLSAHFAPHQIAGFLATDIAADIHFPTDVADAGHSALAKILAQVAAGTGGSHSDLLI